VPSVTFSASGACAILDPANANVVSITGTGLCEVIASQAGNAAYAPAPLVTETVTVEKAAATVAFDAGTLHQTYDGLVKTVSTTTSPVGLQGDISFTVTATGGDSGNPVTFSVLGACSVLDGLVTITRGGSCTITASQAGNANYTGAADVPRSFTIAAPPVTNRIVNPGDQVNREGDEVELAIQVLGVRSPNRGKGGDNAERSRR
jgi:trimeric autotransporter adhesin